ncbi:10438_t:CDS:2, partial [Cetraspora pellucida]
GGYSSVCLENAMDKGKQNLLQNAIDVVNEEDPPYTKTCYNLLQSSSMEGELGTIRKHIFEYVAYRFLQKDGKFNTRFLGSGSVPNILFQITISAVHPIKLCGLTKLYDKLGGTSCQEDIYLYFVVPSDLYRNFQHQSICTTGVKMFLLGSLNDSSNMFWKLILASYSNNSMSFC